MKKLLLTLTIALCALTAVAQDDIVLKGQTMPSFSMTVKDGTFHSESLNNKVKLIAFFATWCGPCRAELPEIQSRIWEKYKDNPDFSLLIIGRQHTQAEVDAFREQNKFSMPFYADPDRSVYNLFAKQYIPRCYLINRDNKVIFTSQGFNKSDFEDLVKLIEKQLK